MSVVKFLSERGLAFRRSSDIFCRTNNENVGDKDSILFVLVFFF